MNQDDYCCLDGCCGPGSWCCGHARPHTHDDESDDREALYSVAEWTHCKWIEDHPADATDVRVRTGTGANALAAECATCGEAVVPKRFRRHPEPVNPSREEAADAGMVAAAVNGADVTPDQMLHITDAVLALWPGRSADEVKAEALREWIGQWPTSPRQYGKSLLADVARDGLARADRIERGES